MVGDGPMVSMQGVQKWFGDLHVLQDIDLDVAHGEVVVLIGPSGSGKSTLCRTINRLETIDEGTILIDGQKLPEEGKGLANLRADVGMVFQSFNLFAHKTVLENVTLGPIKVRKASKALWGELLQAGAEIYEYQPTMYHCKVMIVDGFLTSVGSTNFDNRSFRLNDEANLNIYDAAFAAAQTAIFEDDRARSKRITYEAWQNRPWSEKAVEWLASALRLQL